jgi:site-specific recombinase XerD
MGEGKAAGVLLRFHFKGGKVEYNKLDEETSVVFLEYLHAKFGKRLLSIAPTAPIWVSYSKQKKGKAISVQTLSAICRNAFGTSKNYVLRHTFAGDKICLGAPITNLSAALWHTDSMITQRYVKGLEKSAENPLGKKLVTRFGIKRKGQ